MLDIWPIDIRHEPGKPPIIGKDVPHLVGFTVGCLLAGSADPPWITVEAGQVVLRGVNADGRPVVLRYRPIGFRPSRAPADEGGLLICERVPPAPPRGGTFVVHIADQPAADHVQRCAVCGATLINNQGWTEAGRVAVPAGDEHHGPSWWPTGAVVATDKPADGHGGGHTYTVNGRPLADDETPCTPGPS